MNDDVVRCRHCYVPLLALAGWWLHADEHGTAYRYCRITFAEPEEAE